ncbi:MAG: hypothetical protein ACXWUB_09655, partial [Burkholderiales bacterium]
LAGYSCASSAVGWLSDRVQRRKPIMLGFATAYLSCWLAWIAGVPSAWTLFVAATMGVALAGFSLSWACAKEVNAPAYAGMATSLANLGGFVSAGILQPLVGWILDIARSSGRTPAAAFDMALGVFALFACIGLAGALFIRETRCRNISAGD